MSERNQAVTAAMVMGNSVDWDRVDPQEVIAGVNSGRVGRALTKWLANKGWLPPCPPPLLIDRSKSAHEIGPKWPVWRGPVIGNGLEGVPDIDPRASEIKALDASKAKILTVVRTNDKPIHGELKLKRLRAGVDILIDAQTLWALYVEKGQVTLRWLHDVHGVIWVEAMGTVLRDPHQGQRCTLFLHRDDDDGCWYFSDRWLDYDRDASRPAIGLEVE